MTMNEQINKEHKITHLKLALFILMTCYWNMNMPNKHMTSFLRHSTSFLHHFYQNDVKMTSKRCYVFFGIIPHCKLTKKHFKDILYMSPSVMTKAMILYVQIHLMIKTYILFT